MILRTLSRWVITLAWVAAIASVRAPADVVWSGLGLNSNWTTPANWEGGGAPVNDGSEQIVFNPAPRTSIFVDTSQSIRRLRFDFSTGSNVVYSFSGALGATLTVGGDGIEVASGVSPAVGDITFGSSLGLVLGSAQTWDVDTGSSIRVSGSVSGTGSLTLSGGGEIKLSGNNTYTGGTVLESGVLAIENNTALGTGALTVNGTAAIHSTSGSRVIANALNLNSNLLDLLPYGGDFRLTGPVTLGASVNLRTEGKPVYLDGPIGETPGSARKLTLSGEGARVFSGANTYSGGTHVAAGSLFFSNANAVPASGALSSALPGYVGVAFTTGIQSGFVSKFTGSNTFGTIGFDTTPGAINATIFSEPVNMSGLNAFARLGSATRATFSSTAVITPAIAAGYRFGGGGGTMTVESKLTGLNSLTVDSSPSGTPLTLLVSGTSNDYVGLTTVNNSALVFGDGAVSTGSIIGSFVLENGGYIGTTDSTFSTADWLGKFSPLTVTGMIGFDSSDVLNPRTLSGPLDLSSFVAGTSIALGTSSAAILTDSITLPLLQTDYRFAGYKGGWLTVDSVLSGTHGVRIGDASGDYPDVDPRDSTRMSTVFLNGSNSHSGGTTLFSGRLVLGNASALGSGPVTLDGRTANLTPRLETLLASNPTFANQLVVIDDFDIGGVNGFDLAGNIVDGVDTGRLRKYGSFNLTLSGNNAGFSGGFQVNEGTLTFATDTAAGSGGLDLGFASGIAAFTSSAPGISRLSSQSTTAQVDLATGTTLTLNQTSDSTFRGEIRGSGGIAKTGTGKLRLESPSSFTGGTTVTAGTLDAASSGALGTNAIVLNGATSHLKVQPGVTLANSLVFGASGGRLSGHGAFSSNVILGANSVVAPGSSVGTLTFTTALTLAPGGSYEFEMQNATGGPGIGWDFVQVDGPLTFTSTPTMPATLNLISLNSGGVNGNPADFLASNAYSWAIASATSFVNFNAGAVTLNTLSFTSSLNGGMFSLSTSGNDLLLNFTPVPEPSTWAMLLAGLGLVGFRKLRRRRR